MSEGDQRVYKAVPALKSLGGVFSRCWCSGASFDMNDIIQHVLCAGLVGETASAVVVLESAVRQYEDILGIRHPGISTLSKKAEKLLTNLDSEQREQVG